MLLSRPEFNRMAKKHGLIFPLPLPRGSEEDVDTEEPDLYIVFNHLLQQETQETLASAMLNAEWCMPVRNAIVTAENYKIARKQHKKTKL